jgi:dTDP-4-dehydrorhamnose reductase
MDKILVTGANGLLGQELVNHLIEKGFNVIGVSRGPMRFNINSTLFNYYPVDIKDEFGLNDVIRKEEPAIIIHTAAMTQVDECELNKEECFDINREGTANVLRLAEKHCSFIIHVSTDFVFDGVKGMYIEEDECKPVNWYGHCKLQAESIIKNAEMPWAIVRTCLVYGNVTGAKRNHFIKWVKDKLGAGEKIKVVDDQIRTPTYIGDLAKGIISIAERKAAGVFHISGKDLLTPYQMAVMVARHLGLNEYLIEKVTAKTFTQAAMRPAKTGFIIDKAVRELNFQPVSFDEGLKRVLGN